MKSRIQYRKRISKMQLLGESVEEHKRIQIPKSSLQSYEKFLERLKSFSIQKWFDKSNKHTPIACAKYGWSHFDTDILKCSICLNKFYLLRKTVEKADGNELNESHSIKCPWRTLCVSDELINIDLTDKAKLFQTYESYLNTFGSCKKVPDIQPCLIDQYGLSVLGIHNANLYTHLFALCGWSYVIKTNTLQCKKCLRNIGIWLYRCLDNCGDGEVADCMEHILKKIELTNKENQSLSKKRRLDDKHTTAGKHISNEEHISLFDPVKAHYTWCPWLIAADDNSGKRALEINIESVRHLIIHKNTEKTHEVISDVNVAFNKMRSIQSLLSKCATTYN
jgi:hypothetical protein